MDNHVAPNHYYLKALTLSAKICSIYASSIDKQIDEKKQLLNDALNYIEKATKIIEDSV